MNYKKEIPKVVKDKLVEVLEELGYVVIKNKDRVRDNRFYYDYGKFIKEVRFEVIR